MIIKPLYQLVFYAVHEEEIHFFNFRTYLHEYLHVNVQQVCG